MASNFATKPQQPANFNRPVDIVTNCYKMVSTRPNQQHHMYSMKTEPELPDDSRKLNDLTRASRDQLKAALDFYMAIGRCIYSFKQHQDPIVVETELDGQLFTVTYSWSCAFGDGDPQLTQYYGRLFKMLMKRNSFEQIGRNCYNPAKKVVKQNIEIWPGIFSVLKPMHGG